MTNSKKKGDTFERKIAKELTDWWGVQFNRSPQSGGASWGADNNAVGDIVVPDYAGFPLVIECKHRENWLIDNVLLNNKEPHTWWQQVVNDSSKVNKIPCLIFTRNRAQSYVALPYIEDVYGDIRDKDLPVMRTDFIIENIRKDKFYYDVLITTMSALTDFKPSYIREHYDKKTVQEYKKVESDLSQESKQEDEMIDDLLNHF
ncbi:RusA-like Holliday junction resolvase [Staphylococcus phage CF5]|uniref:RusA-like Holliday junction resolvase n=1 Tax=Staphylococcus phage CF5 TaxID=3113739 RepID=A0AAX4J7H8_9CAUD|nr:RusA-like Holliday junction resolvase [Staphylococcus phage CF5]